MNRSSASENGAHPSAAAAAPDAGVLAERFSAALEQALTAGNLDAIQDEQLRRAFAALVKVYAAKAELTEGEELQPVERGAITATETVVTACALIRAADLNLFDVAMWFGRGQPQAPQEPRR